MRKAGYGTEIYPDPKKLGQQLKYAGQRGFQVALIAGSNELDAQQCQLKELATGESQVYSLTPPAVDLLAAIKKLVD